MQFIRLYVTTLRREYYLLRSVLDLMHPTGLGVKSFMDATKMALALEDMHQDFESQLNRIQKKDNLRKVKVQTGPTTDELADLFSLSFFKLVQVTDGPAPGTKIKTDDGWFSGKPTEWKKALALYKGAPAKQEPTLPDLMSTFFNTLLKFFPFEGNTKKWHDGPFSPKKLWPPANEYEDEDAQYFEDDDEDDSSPFDMFFDPEDEE